MKNRQPLPPLEYIGATGGLVPASIPAADRQIPVHSFDLQRYLIEAACSLSQRDQQDWRRFCTLFGAVLHHQYQSWTQGLQEQYAALDPDAEAVRIEGTSREFSEKQDERFLKAFETVLRRANFRELGTDEVRKAVDSPNELGLNYEPNFELFEHLRVFVRGRTRVERSVRNIRTRWRKRTVQLDAFRRMIVVVKFRSGSRLDTFARTNVVYLRLFKDVPFVDMEMHLPVQGTRVKMRAIDKAQIASPLFVGLPALAFKLFTASLISPFAVGGVLVAPISAGVRSFFGFRNARQRHLHHMIRNLYYLTLANNLGVIHWLVAEAEEEDFKEALLAYYTLLQHAEDPQACRPEVLDREVEELLGRLTGMRVDFDIEDGLRKLVRIGLAQPLGDGTFHPLGLEAGLKLLDERWDDLFPYAGTGPRFEAGPPAEPRDDSGAERGRRPDGKHPASEG